MSRLTPDAAALRIVFPISSVPAKMEMPATVFSLNVLFVIVMVAVPSLKIPPNEFSELLLTVLLLMVRLAIPLAPSFAIAPPMVATFPLNAVSVMVRLAPPPPPLPLLKMPPPSPCWPRAEFPARAQLFKVRALCSLRMPPPKLFWTEPLLIASPSIATA